MRRALTNYWRNLSPALQRYYRASALPSVLFLALTIAHEAVARPPLAAMPWRIAFAVAPVLAMAWMFGFYLCFLRECDELERRIELAALAWAAGIAMHAIIAGVFLFDAGLIHLPAKQVVAGLGLLLFGSYALVRSALHRRYA